MSDLDLCYISAGEALARFKARSLSPVELLEALIAREEAVGEKINCFADRYYDEALKKAKKAEARYMKSDGRLRALEGLPLAVKDEGLIKGKRTTSGSLINKDFIAETTSPVNDRLIRAGAIEPDQVTVINVG